MLKTLIGVRLIALRVWFTGGGRNKKVQSKASIIGFSLLMAYSLFALGALFWLVFDSISAPFSSAGLSWLFFAITAISSFALMFIGSVFFTKVQLYEAKDNDLLLSMPVNPGDILFSRMVMLLVISAVFGLPVVLSGLIVGLRDGLLHGAGLTAYITLFLLMPFFSVALAALFGWLLALITGRLKHKAIVGTVICTLFIVVYSYWMGKLNSAISALAGMAGEIAERLGPVAPVYWFGKACAGGDVKCFVFAAFFLAAVFALVYALLKATFLRIATTKHAAAKEKYRETKAREVTPDGALLRKEFGRLTSSSAYMVNSGLGILFMLVAAIGLIIKWNTVQSFVLQSMPAPIATPIVLASLSLLSSMNYITAPSVSLEGSSIWILKSMPVSENQILTAKLKMCLRVSIPPLIFLQAVILVLLKPDFASAVLIVLLPLVFTVFTGLVGLMENLRHVALDWTNETQAIKSGVGVLFTMLICWGAIALPVGAYFLLGGDLSVNVIAAVFLGLLCLCCCLIYRWILTEGAARFRAL